MKEDYSEYDYILSGHSHINHYLEVLFRADKPETRNKKNFIHQP